MNNESHEAIAVEKLLRWRLNRAEAAAPPAPRASRLLALVRPWWETAPEQFTALVQRVTLIQVAYGHAMEERNSAHSGHRVAVLIAGAGEEKEAFARILYYSVRDGQLRLRFQLHAGTGPVATSFEVTFVSATGQQPLFSADASSSVDNEYRLDTGLPAELAIDWQRLKVTDEMPFRLILRPSDSGP